MPTNASQLLSDFMGAHLAPEMFGARGDGTTNDSAAFQAAVTQIASTGGGTLYLRGVTYVCNFLLPGNVWLQGSGAGGTTLKSAAGSGLDVIQGSQFLACTNTGVFIPETRGDNYTRITDLTVDGNKAHNTAGYGVRIWGAGHDWNNVIVQNCAEDGIWTEYSDASGAVGPGIANPMAGLGLGTFASISCFANGGNGWSYSGPGDGVVRRLLSVNNGSWGFQSFSKTISGLCTVSGGGANVAETSGSTFVGLLPGGTILIAGASYYIATVPDSTHATLTGSGPFGATYPATGTGIAFSCLFNLGTIDSMSESNIFSNTVGGIYCGTGAQISRMHDCEIDGSPIGIKNATYDMQMTNMNLSGHATYGIDLSGGEMLFQGVIEGCGIAIVLGANGGFGESAINVIGAGNKLGIQNQGEFAGSTIQALFDCPAGPSTTATQATPGTASIVVASATGIVVNQAVSGPGIAPGTYVTLITGTTISLSQGTAAAISGAPVNFSGNLATFANGYWSPSSAVTILAVGALNISQIQIPSVFSQGILTLQSLTASYAGTCTTSVAGSVYTATRASGSLFTGLTGSPLTINGVTYGVIAVAAGGASCTLNASAGTQASPVAFSAPSQFLARMQALNAVLDSTGVLYLNKTTGQPVEVGGLLTVDGDLIVGGPSFLNEFGCNSASPQPSAPSGGAVIATPSTQITPYGYATSAQADEIVTALNNIRAALVANGIMS